MKCWGGCALVVEKLSRDRHFASRWELTRSPRNDTAKTCAPLLLTLSSIFCVFLSHVKGLFLQACITMEERDLKSPAFFQMAFGLNNLRAGDTPSLHYSAAIGISSEASLQTSGREITKSWDHHVIKTYFNHQLVPESPFWWRLNLHPLMFIALCSLSGVCCHYQLVGYCPTRLKESQSCLAR